MGAVHALILQLGYCLQSPEEYTLIVTCLHRILSQCATLQRTRVWQEIGLTEMVPLLLQVRAWSVLRLWCKISVAKSKLIRFPGFLSQLVELLSTTTRSANDDDEHSAQIQTMNLLAALKDLSFRTHASDKRILWDNLNGLTGQLVEIVTGKRRNGDERCREYIASFWWNLALVVASEMAAHPTVPSALLHLLQDDSSVRIRSSAVAALGTIVSTTENDNGLDKNDDELWSVLQDLALNEEDVNCRRRVVRTLRCLLAANPRTDVMEVLTTVARDDTDIDTRLQALEGLRHLQSSLSLTQALVSIIESSVGAVKVTWVACRMLIDSPVLAKLITSSQEFWQALSDLVQAVPESHDRIAHLMVSVSKVEGGHETLLLGVATLAQLVPTQAQISLTLIDELLLSTTHGPRLAECSQLLSSLVNLCLLPETKDEEKEQAKTIILQLVPAL